MVIPAVAVCKLATFFIGLTEVQYATAPIGSCSYCCPIDNSRHIHYLLYTRSNSRNFQVLRMGDLGSLRDSAFDPALPTVIYLIGFSDVVPTMSSNALKDAYLSQGDYNFIAVDWGKLITFPWYITAVTNTRYMGTQLANFIQFLALADVQLSAVHVIGFSLGAEAAGFAGKDLKKRGLKIARITGLDPAYPGYRFTDRTGHLSKGDAAFVDVIHTNPGLLGFPSAIGDVDFYPNPGLPSQPGCKVNELIRNKQLGYFYGCSHNRSWRFYAESVTNPRGFPATRCRRWTGFLPPCNHTSDGLMGFGATNKMKGKMYLRTNEATPYARNGP